jgi:hypothetical protein
MQRKLHFLFSVSATVRGFFREEPMKVNSRFKEGGRWDRGQ